MRLFIGINFDDNIKEGLFKIGQDIKSHSSAGNFTLKENIHLTLRFLGEYNNTLMFKNALINTARNTTSFDITICDLGTFRQNILWISVLKSKELYDAYHLLEEELLKIGIPKDIHGLSPHITLARKPILNKKLNEFHCPKLQTEVTGFTLFESKRINNRLTYIPLFKSNLIQTDSMSAGN